MSLSSALLAEGRRQAVVTDLVGVVEAEVKTKTGFTGAAVKTAYAAVSKASPGIVTKAVNQLLPEFARALDPYWTDFAASGQGDFGAFLASRGQGPADALLAVTDARAERVQRAPIRKAYQGLRGKAVEHVTAALPRLGTTLQRHA